MLDVKLDALIEPSMSFIAPQSEDELLSHCLSDLFLAAEPGHPIMARAIENVLRFLLLGTDDRFDEDSSTVERFVLESSGKAIYETEIWKLRALRNQDDYIYSGCALGVAVNQVLGRETPVSDFEVGKLRNIANGGDLLILLVSVLLILVYFLFGCCQVSLLLELIDMNHAQPLCLTGRAQTSRDDTGARRITDLDRNLLVCSTEYVGLDRSDVRQKSRATVRAARTDRADIVV